MKEKIKTSFLYYQVRLKLKRFFLASYKLHLRNLRVKIASYHTYKITLSPFVKFSSSRKLLLNKETNLTQEADSRLLLLMHLTRQLPRAL